MGTAGPTPGPLRSWDIAVFNGVTARSPNSWKHDLAPRGLVLLTLIAVAGAAVILSLPFKYAIALTLALVIGVGVVAKPWLGAAFLAIFLPANNLISQILGDGAMTTAIGAAKDATLAILLIVVGLRRTARRDIAIPAGIFAVLGLLGFAYADTFNAGLYGWRNDYEAALLLIALPGILNEQTGQRVKNIMIGAGQVAAATAVLTWREGLSWLATVHVYPVAAGEPFPTSFFSTGSIRPRAFSPLVAPNELGVYLDLTLAVIWTRSDWSIGRRIALSVLPIVAIYLADSRSAMAGVVILACVLAVRRVYQSDGFSAAALTATAFALATIGALLYVFVSGGAAQSDDPSLAGHETSLQTGIPMAISHPLGLGLGNVGTRAQVTTTAPVLVESFWLILALESGFVVLVAWIALLTIAGARCARDGSSGAFLGTAAIASSLVSQLVLPTMQDGPVSFTLFMLVGIAWIDVRPQQRVRR